MFLKVRISLEYDRIFGSLQKLISVDISSQWHELTFHLQCVSHSDILRMAREWNNITSFKGRKLIEYCLSYFRQSRSIPRRIISLSASLSLYWLECDPSDTWLRRREFEDFSDFVVVLSFFYDDDECRGDVIFIQVFDRFHADFREIGSSDLLQVFALE